jgi:hypothetical protein
MGGIYHFRVGLANGTSCDVRHMLSHFYLGNHLLVLLDKDLAGRFSPGVYSDWFLTRFVWVLQSLPSMWFADPQECRSIIENSRYSIRLALFDLGAAAGLVDELTMDRFGLFALFTSPSRMPSG